MKQTVVTFRRRRRQMPSAMSLSSVPDLDAPAIGQDRRVVEYAVGLRELGLLVGSTVRT